MVDITGILSAYTNGEPLSSKQAKVVARIGNGKREILTDKQIALSKNGTSKNHGIRGQHIRMENTKLGWVNKNLTIQENERIKNENPNSEI